MAIGTRDAEVIRSEIAGLFGHDLAQKARELSVAYQCSPNSIYRITRDLRVNTRRDRGTERIEGMNPEIIKKMFGLSINEEYDYDAQTVIDIAERNGWIESGALTVSTYNRILARRGISRKAVKGMIRPHRRFEAEYPNRMHQMDTTVAQQFYVDWDGSIGYEPNLTMNKNKAGNRKPRMHMYVLIDDFSRVKFARFYRGNIFLNWLDFLFRCWCPKDDPVHFPFQGLPDILYTDNDSATKTKPFVLALQKLGVIHQKHEVGNSQAKGKVERAIGVLQGFEKITRARKLQLSEANELLDDYLYKMNNREHSTTHEIPIARWYGNVVGHLRLMPSEEIQRQLFYDQSAVKVNSDLTLRLKTQTGKIWQLPRKEPWLSAAAMRRTVDVFWHRGILEAITVAVDDKAYEIAYQAPETLGLDEFEKHFPKSDVEKRLEALAEMDYSDTEMAGFYKEKYADKTFFPLSGEEMPVAAPMQRKVLSKTQLLLRLMESGTVSGAQKAYIERLYAGDAEVYEDQWEEIAGKVEAVRAVKVA